MKIHGLILLFFFAGVSFFCRAAHDPLDSLKVVIVAMPEDSNKVNELIDLSVKYRNASVDSALIHALGYAEEAKALAEKIRYPRGLGYALKAIGIAYNQQGDYVPALQAWKEALNVFELAGIKAGVANMENNIGAVYYSKSLEDSAQHHYLRSLNVAEEIKDTLRIATALMNLGTLYSNKPATYNKALDFYFRSLPLNIAIADNDNLGTNLVNIGEIYLNKSLNVDSTRADNERDMDSALVYLLKARDVEVGTTNLPYALKTIGIVYREKGNFEEAIRYQQMAYDSAKIFDLTADMGQALLEKAETYRASKDYKSAIPVYKNAEEIFKGIGQDATYDLEKVYKGLSAAYSEEKDFGNAFIYQSALIDVKNKIYNLDIDNKIAGSLFKYEDEKSQGEIMLQKEIVGKQKLIRNGFIGGFAVVLLFAGVFFTQRNRISKEKKRSDELLLNILPEETAEELKATGTAKAKSFDMVSVLFTDFKNFTQASEKLSPEELVAEINYCYSEFDKIITRHGIEKIKTIGDAYMCAGGLPATNATNPFDVVQAGLEMVAFIEKNKTDRMLKGQPFFELRCGIHTGPVVAGIVGIKKFAYDIWGDTVNTASRMESSGEIGKVNISGSTYELIKEKFICVHRGKVKAKNKGEIDMYFVEGPLS